MENVCQNTLNCTIHKKSGEYAPNISARQCHNSPTVISVCDHRTEIDTQPLPITCYEYVDTK